MDAERAWRCPLCGATALSGAEHIRAEHSTSITAEDRFGLRAATRPPARPRRPARRRLPGDDVEPVPPAKPAPLPPEAAVLRLVCDALEGADLARLQARLADLAGVDSVAIDMYEHTVDLFLDRRRAAPPHLVTLAVERVGLAVTTAELHRAPAPGTRIGPDTRLLTVA